jgi:hypothetical protein
MVLELEDERFFLRAKTKAPETGVPGASMAVISQVA